MGKLVRFLLLALVLLSACAPGAGITAPTPDPDLAKLAGAYHCMGHEFGMIAGFGAFRITPDGKLNDGQKDWTLAASGAPLTFSVVEHPQFAQLLIQPDGTFHIAMKPGLKVGHADDGYVWCSRDS
jgi:hypothetical protein